LLFAVCLRRYYDGSVTRIEFFNAKIIKIITLTAFQESYMRAINSKVEQEQLRQAADNKLKTVESEQKQKVAIAEAEASAVRATADGEAYATLKNAEAQAEALKIQNAALVQSNSVLELRRSATDGATHRRRLRSSGAVAR
jgi:prohibitin 2